MQTATSYRLGQFIVLEQTKIAEQKSGIAYLKLALLFAFITTWILYFIFAFGFYVADVWGISTWLTENTSELIAFTLFLVMALFMAQSLSMIKHAFYHHKAGFKYGVGALLVICSLGVFMELFNSSSQQQAIAHQSAEKSKTFDSVANTQISIDGGANHSNRIAYLSGELAKAREYLNGCKKTCKTYQVKVADLTAQIEALQVGQAQANELASRASTNAIKAKTEAMSALKEEAHKPVFKFIRDTLGVTLSTAVVLIAAIVSAGFEYSHALLSKMLGEKQNRLEELQANLIKLRTDYLQAAGVEYGRSPAMDLDTSEPSPSPFKYQQAAPFVSGFVSFKDAPKSRGQGSAKSSDLVPTPKEEPLPLPNFGGFKARRDTWATPELETEATPSNHQLGVQEENPQQPPARGSMGLYDEWVQAVKAGECKASVDPTWSWIQKRISNKETGSRTHDRTRISNMQKAFFARAMKEGLMIENPNYRNGGKKYLWTA